MEERKRRDEEELAGFVNPFPTGVNEVRVRLPEELFEEDAGTYVVDRSGQDPNDNVKLSKLGASKEKKQTVQQNGAHSEQSPPEVSERSVVLASQPQPSAATMVGTLGAFRAHTFFGAALQKGTLNEKNPTRDYVRAGILAIAAFTCIGLAAAHGNIPFIVAGCVLLGIAWFLYCRATQADPNSMNKQSLSGDLGLRQRALL